MSQDISLSSMEAERDELVAKRRTISARILRLDRVIAEIKKLHGNGSTPPKGPAHKTPRQTRQASLPLSNGLPTIREAVMAVLKEHPGLTVSEVIDRLKGRVATAAQDQRKVLSTRISQFVQADWIVRQGDKLFIGESKR